MGLPHLGNLGGGLGSPGNPGFPSETARHPGPARSSYQEQTKGPRRLRKPGALQNPQGKGYLAVRGRNPFGRPRAQRRP